ncbi:MAG: hypothetical protein ABWW66_04895 [Archaeoglobaceae archaeon]
MDSSRVDDLMDEPYKVLGRKHRILRHDPAFIACLSLDRGLEEGLKAYLHLILDEDKTLSRLFRVIEDVEV